MSVHLWADHQAAGNLSECCRGDVNQTKHRTGPSSPPHSSRNLPWPQAPVCCDSDETAEEKYTPYFFKVGSIKLTSGENKNMEKGKLKKIHEVIAPLLGFPECLACMEGMPLDNLIQGSRNASAVNVTVTPITVCVIDQEVSSVTLRHTVSDRKDICLSALNMSFSQGLTIYLLHPDLWIALVAHLNKQAQMTACSSTKTKVFVKLPHCPVTFWESESVTAYLQTDHIHNARQSARFLMSEVVYMAL